MQNLIITTIQTDLYWEDSKKNLEHFEEKLNAITQITDIIILPEMFTTGFTMNPTQLSELHEGIGLQWMQKKAIEKKCVIVGSISVKDNNHYFNRLYWVKPDATYLYYDKRHLFSMAKENQFYSAGNKELIIEHKGWKIKPLICYDLRFPVWSRNKKENSYDVLVYVANWPAVRSYAWKQLLIARAIENQAYVIGVNRIGVDGKSNSYSGDSGIIDGKGEWMSLTKANEDSTETTELSYAHLVEYRTSFPAILDADNFTI